MQVHFSIHDEAMVDTVIWYWIHDNLLHAIGTIIKGKTLPQAYMIVIKTQKGLLKWLTGDLPHKIYSQLEPQIMHSFLSSQPCKTQKIYTLYIQSTIFYAKPNAEFSDHEIPLIYFSHYFGSSSTVVPIIFIYCLLQYMSFRHNAVECLQKSNSGGWSNTASFISNCDTYTRYATLFLFGSKFQKVILLISLDLILHCWHHQTSSKCMDSWIHHLKCRHLHQCQMLEVLVVVLPVQATRHAVRVSGVVVIALLEWLMEVEIWLVG